MNHSTPLNPTSKIICLLLSLVGGLVLTTGLMLLYRPVPVLANTRYDVGLAKSAYPDIDGTDLECKLCHISDGSKTLNTYGLDYQNNGRNGAALTAIENLDSDGDGYLNIDEINALTSPGDASDFPVEATDDMALALEKYPALAGTRLDCCQLCHTSGSDLNDYGQDYLDGGRDLAAFGLIEADDSDQDGYTNLQEINALTFPGNPSDNPSVQHTYDSLLLQQYPEIAGTVLDSCDLCHTGDFDLNSYGADYAAGYDFVAIEGLDSDGDSHTNIIELTLLTFPGDPADAPDDMSLTLLKYPNIENTRLHSCNVCHNTGDGWTSNPYGTDYLAAGRNWEAFGLIEANDSDEDGYTNQAELIALTFPGDPDDNPASAEPEWQVFLPILLK